MLSTEPGNGAASSSSFSVYLATEISVVHVREASEGARRPPASWPSWPWPDA